MKFWKAIVAATMLAGWTGVVALATVCGIIALAIRLVESARLASAPAEMA